MHVHVSKYNQISNRFCDHTAHRVEQEHAENTKYCERTHILSQIYLEHSLSTSDRVHVNFDSTPSLRTVSHYWYVSWCIRVSIRWKILIEMTTLKTFQHKKTDECPRVATRCTHTDYMLEKSIPSWRFFFIISVIQSIHRGYVMFMIVSLCNLSISNSLLWIQFDKLHSLTDSITL